jgi:hypothetical protein
VKLSFSVEGCIQCPVLVHHASYDFALRISAQAQIPPEYNFILAGKPRCLRIAILQILGSSASPRGIASMAQASRTIVWFRNDLRLQDNYVIAEAMRAAKMGHEIVPIYCFDDRFMSASNVLDRQYHKRLAGEAKMGAFRAKFLLESVNDLKSSLKNIGSNLLIYYDRPEHVIPSAQTSFAKNVSNFCR